jgi:hypothetical protein
MRSYLRAGPKVARSAFNSVVAVASAESLAGTAKSPVPIMSLMNRLLI